MDNTMRGNTTITNSQLEPLACPFCGKTSLFIGTDSEIEYIENGSGFYAVVCPFTDGGCGAAGGYRKTRNEAIEAWNKRVEK